MAPREGVSQMDLRNLALVVEDQLLYLRKFVFIGIVFDNPRPDFTSLLMALAASVTLRVGRVLEPSKYKAGQARSSGYYYNTFISGLRMIPLSQFEMGLTQVGPLLDGVRNMLKDRHLETGNVKLLCAEANIDKYLNALSRVDDNINVVFRMLSERTSLFLEWQKWQMIGVGRQRLLCLVAKYNDIKQGHLGKRPLMTDHKHLALTTAVDTLPVSRNPKRARFVKVEGPGGPFMLRLVGLPCDEDNDVDERCMMQLL